MRFPSKLAATALATLLQACATAPVPVAAPQASAVAEIREPVTILVSIDGFRPDYLERGVTPILSRLAREGVTAPMRPSFPSKTFPNHWTLVTGLRPDRHGIVANRMEDPGRPDEVFTMAVDDPFWWSDAQPIWVDAEKAGIRTATMFWPGSNVPFGGTVQPGGHHKVTGGTRPSDWQQFNQAVSGEQRVNGVLDWLRRPAATRPRLVTLYFDTVDTAGHALGPNDRRTTDSVADVDRMIGQLVEGLAAMRQPANLVIVADHGMAETSDKRMVMLGLPADSYRLVESGPYAALTPAPGREALVEKALLGRHPHMECWRKRDIPARLHYGRNPRVPAILCLAESGWLISDKPAKGPFTQGAHGYDHASPDMAALFIAHGPAFRSAQLPAFDNVDVYPLLRDLIGLPAKKDVDGDGASFGRVVAR